MTDVELRHLVAAAVLVAIVAGTIAWCVRAWKDAGKKDGR